MVAGEYGRGRVVWSGMNLFYHVKSYRSSEESRFIRRILSWLSGGFESSVLSCRVEFVNPQRRIVWIDGSAGGVLFKENYFRQWHAALIVGGERRRVSIYLAGPGLMYIPLPRNMGDHFEVLLWYDLSIGEKVGYVVSVFSLVLLLILVLRRPDFLFVCGEDS